MHFLAKNAICTYKKQLAVILSPLSYNKVLIQTLEKQRVEVNTSSLFSLPENKVIKLNIEDKSSVSEVNEQLISVYGDYQKLVGKENKKLMTDFERFKNNLLKSVQEKVLDDIQ